MQLKKFQLGGKEVMPFTIPSGIVMTDVKCTARLLNLVPEIGIWTTKSIGEKERIVPEGDEVLNPNPSREYGNREPILAQIDDGTFVNAVRLVNPGKDKMREYLLSADIPKDRITNCSVFGGTISEVTSVITTLEDVVDCYEINGSCPHSEKGGMIIGLDPQSVYDFVKASVNATKKPVFFKFTPNTDKVGLIVKAAQEAGAIGVVGINTIGPYIHYFNSHPVLTSKIGGGISGRKIKQRSLECISEARNAARKDFLIIAMGGIATAQDIRDFIPFNPDAIGIGSALAGMDDFEIARYFTILINDLENGTDFAESLLKKVDMQYRKVKIIEKIEDACDTKIFRTDKNIRAEPGQFVFAWIPGVGEKPFSVMDDNPLTLGILEKGEFTRKINSLKEKDYFYFRGPYGKAVNIPDLSNVVLVGGGCGIAGLYLFAKKLSEKSNIISLLAAKDKEHIPYIKEFEKYGEVKIATEDGSLGRKGMITDLFENSSLKQESYFFNCGPKVMVDAVLPLELKFSKPEKVYSSVDYMTRCGIGICGSCADEKGRRTCVEGPFMNP